MDKVSDAVTEVKDSAGDLAEEQVAAIESAVDDLRSYKDDLDELDVGHRGRPGLGREPWPPSRRHEPRPAP